MSLCSENCVMPYPWDLAADLECLEKWLRLEPSRLPPREFLDDMNYKWHHARDNAIANGFVLQFFDGKLTMNLANAPAEMKLDARREKIERSWGPKKFFLKLYNQRKTNKLRQKEKRTMVELVDKLNEAYREKQHQHRKDIAKELLALSRRVAEADGPDHPTRGEHLHREFREWTRGTFGEFLPIRKSLKLHGHGTHQLTESEHDAKHMQFI